MTDLTAKQPSASGFRQTHIGVYWGLLSGGLLTAFNLLIFFFSPLDQPEHFETGELVGYTAILASLLVLFLAARDFYKANPEASYWGGVKTTLLAGVIASIAFGLYNVFYSQVLDPDFIDTFFAYSIEQVRLSGAADAEAQIAAMEADKEMFASPLTQFMVMGMTVLALAIPASLISAFIAKPKAA